MSDATPYLFRAVACEYAATGSSTIELRTALPGGALNLRETVILPATSGRAVLAPTALHGTTKGRIFSVRVTPSPSANTDLRLYRLGLYMRKLGREASDWFWYWVQVVPTTNDWVELRLPVPPTPEEWNELPLPVPATPEEWSEFAAPVPETPEAWSEFAAPVPETPEAWGEMPLPVPATPEAWSELAVPVPQSPETQFVHELPMDE